ncbi:MAG TPA: DUF1697 domain-containing protein [Pyrinomonadaceae bacterium]
MRYVALLRGINLGGANQMKMDDLKAVFAELGFENVKSYINSGNLAFDTRKAAENKLIDKIETAVEKRFGRRVHIMVREQTDIGRIVKNNPFQGEYESHKHMHVLFLKEPLPAGKQELLQASALPGERYEARGREIYNHLPNGVAGSLLTKGFFEKKPVVAYTGRNWRTVEKLAEL